MKKTKKLMALIVVIAILVSALSFTATASAEETVTSVRVTEADKNLSVKLKALGVITDQFKMTNYVTRGEMASIAANFAEVPSGTASQAFSDVSPEHPYYGVIGALHDMGVVTGDENSKFNPDDYVTYDEALVYVINTIGYKAFAVREGGYPTGYYRIAIKYGMLEDISIKNGADYATLADIYRILNKAMNAASVVTTYYGDGDVNYTLSQTETFLTATRGIRQYRGVVTGIEGTRLTSVDSNVRERQVEIGNTLYELGGFPEFNLLGYCVDFYVSDEASDVIMYIEETARRNEIIRINAEDLVKEKTTASRIYYKEYEDKEYHVDLDRNFNMIYNGQYYDMYGTILHALPDNGYVEVLDNNRDGIYETLFIFTYKNVVVELISTDLTTFRDKITATGIDLSDDNQIVNVYYRDSRKLAVNSIQVGDVLSIAESKGTPKILTVHITRQTAVGKIEQSDSQRGYYIDGEWHKVASDYSGTALTVGLEGTFYLDVNNEIAYHDYDVSNRKGQTAVMSGVDYELGNFGSKISIRVFTQKAEIVYLNLKEKVKVNGRKYDISERQDAEAVLTLLATEVSGNDYLVNSAYVLNYTTDDDDNVTEIDLGGIGGEGALNVLVKKCTSMLVRSNNILGYTVSGVRTRQRLNPTGSVVFGVPNDGDLDNFDEYTVTSLLVNVIYGAGQADTDNTRGITDFDVYSYKETEAPMADVVMIRGNGAVSKAATKDSALDIIVGTGVTVDEYGMTTPKLYMANNEYALASEVTLTKNGTDTDTVSTDIADELKKGTVVQYELNKDGAIYAIRLVAEYDSTTKILKPIFKNSSTYIENDVDSPTKGTNIMMGTIEINDLESGQIYFKTPDPLDTQLYFLYQTSGSVVIYDTETGKATKGSAADIMPGDVFVTNTSVFYVPNTLVIFR